MTHGGARDSQFVVVEFLVNRAQTCMQCGHCMAICPSGSIGIDGLSYERDFFDLPDETWTGDSFLGLPASRRSVRVFKDRPVSQGDLQKIVDAISLAPMGYPPHKVELTVVQNREVVEQALPLIVKLYEDLECVRF